VTLAALAWAAGAALLQQQPALPPVGCVLLLPFLLFAMWWKRQLAIPACFAMGFLWAAGWAHWRMADRLAPALEAAGEAMEVLEGGHVRGKLVLTL